MPRAGLDEETLTARTVPLVVQLGHVEDEHLRTCRLPPVGHELHADDVGDELDASTNPMR
jgi:hypothetical protein